MDLTRDSTKQKYTKNVKNTSKYIKDVPNNLLKKRHAKRIEENDKSTNKKVKFSNDTMDNEKLPKRGKLKNPSNEILDNSETETAPKGDSKRQLKRAKYEQLKVEQKLKVEAAMQTKILNYLSKWKHNRAEWKFEKLKQIWLQDHVFDSAMIPDEFWDTVTEYFSGAKGQIREFLKDKCIKVIEESNRAKEADSEYDEVKYNRAKTLKKCVI